jgi:site-specific recombinase XerC
MARSREPVPRRFAAHADLYAHALDQVGQLDAHTRRAYDSRIRSYLAWLDSAATDGPDPLTAPEGRDRAVRAYLSHLKTERHLAASTVKAHRTALDHFYAHLGVGPPRVPRNQAPQGAPRTLNVGQQARYLRAAGQRPTRDRAISLLLLHSGARPSELIALDVDDVQMSAGEYLVVIRDEEPRTVPLTDETAQAAMSGWIDERAAWPGAQATRALFMNRHGDRLSTKAISKLVAALARDAGLTGHDGRPDVSPRTLRDTFGANQLAAGSGPLTVPHLVEVSRLLGHRQLDTTLRLAGTSAPGGQLSRGRGLLARPGSAQASATILIRRQPRR